MYPQCSNTQCYCGWAQVGRSGVLLWHMFCKKRGSGNTPLLVFGCAHYHTMYMALRMSCTDNEFTYTMWQPQRESSCHDSDCIIIQDITKLPLRAGFILVEASEIHAAIAVSILVKSIV